VQTKLLSCTRKKPIWQEISTFLLAEDRNEDGCNIRTQTLVSAYRVYKDECRKTGNGTPRKKPAFWDEVGGFLSGKPGLSQRLSLILSKLSSEMVQRTVKKKAKEMPNTLCLTCLLTAATTTKPANGRNQKRLLG